MATQILAGKQVIMTPVTDQQKLLQMNVNTITFSVHCFVFEKRMWIGLLHLLYFIFVPSDIISRAVVNS